MATRLKTPLYSAWIEIAQEAVPIFGVESDQESKVASGYFEAKTESKDTVHAELSASDGANMIRVYVDGTCVGGILHRTSKSQFVLSVETATSGKGYDHALTLSKLRHATCLKAATETPDELGVVRVHICKGEGPIPVEELGEKKVGRVRRFDKGPTKVLSHETIYGKPTSVTSGTPVIVSSKKILQTFKFNYLSKELLLQRFASELNGLRQTNSNLELEDERLRTRPPAQERGAQSEDLASRDGGRELGQ